MGEVIAHSINQLRCCRVRAGDEKEAEAGPVEVERKG